MEMDIVKVYITCDQCLQSSKEESTLKQGQQRTMLAHPTPHQSLAQEIGGMHASKSHWLSLHFYGSIYSPFKSKVCNNFYL